MLDLRVAILGGGSWGTTVAAQVTRNAPVSLWARNPDTVTQINTHHRNETYLPGAILPEKLTATEHIAEAARANEI